jgi:hypothetical protein
LQNTRPLEIVFLTNFADYSYRSIPAIAQMADDFAVRLTIVHTICGAHDAGAEADARAQLASFFPEADLYTYCRRILMGGHPVEAVQYLREMQPVDLVIAPASDPLGLPRIGHRSLRARLMRECGVPVWTISRRTDIEKVRAVPRRVACWVDFDDCDLHHFEFALEYAWKLDLPLHILHTLPPADEAMIFAQGRPLHANAVLSELRKRIGRSPVPLHCHVAESGWRATEKLIRRCGADIVFVADRGPLWNSWLPSKHSLLDNCPCPAVCVPSNLQIPVWNLLHERKRPGFEVKVLGRVDGRERTA